MGHYLHVVLGAVKVGKDKGNLIIGDAGAVAAAALALGGKHVQQLIPANDILLPQAQVGSLVVGLYAVQMCIRDRARAGR